MIFCYMKQEIGHCELSPVGIYVINVSYSTTHFQAPNAEFGIFPYYFTFCSVLVAQPGDIVQNIPQSAHGVNFDKFGIPYHQHTNSMIEPTLPF